MRNQKIIGEGSKKKVQKRERESTRNENISVLLQEDRKIVHGFVLPGDD